MSKLNILLGILPAGRMQNARRDLDRRVTRQRRENVNLNFASKRGKAISFFVLIYALYLTGCESAPEEANVQDKTPERVLDVREMRTLKGKCTKESHIAEGEFGTDLTKRQSRFFCDSAVVAFFDKSRQHLLIQFMETKSETTSIVGFGGFLQAEGKAMNVSRVYLGQDLFHVTEGECIFFFDQGPPFSIACGAPIDRGRRRTVAIVSFKFWQGDRITFD